MNNYKVITFRANSHAEKDIDEIRQQMLKDPLFKNADITDSYIIRLALSTLNEKFKFIIWTK